MHLHSVDDTMSGGRFERFLEVVASDAQEVSFHHFAPITIAGIETIAFRVFRMHHRYDAHRILR